MPERPGTARTLASLVQSEASRALSAEQLAPDPDLVAQGWERRFLVDGARVAEVAQLYGELGFDVRVEPLAPQAVDVPCEACLLASLLQFRTIYTRRHG